MYSAILLLVLVLYGDDTKQNNFLNTLLIAIFKVKNLKKRCTKISGYNKTLKILQF